MLRHATALLRLASEVEAELLPCLRVICELPCLPGHRCASLTPSSSSATNACFSSLSSQPTAQQGYKPHLTLRKEKNHQREQDRHAASRVSCRGISLSLRLGSGVGPIAELDGQPGSL